MNFQDLPNGATPITVIAYVEDEHSLVVMLDNRRLILLSYHSTSGVRFMERIMLFKSGDNFHLLPDMRQQQNKPRASP